MGDRRASFLDYDPDLEHDVEETKVEEKAKGVEEDEIPELTYEELLDRAKSSDFTDIEKLKFITKEGNDLQGRPIIMVVGAQIPLKSVNLGGMLLYALQFLEPLVSSEYVLVYAQSGSSSANRPSFSWLKKVYKVLPKKYKKNLKALYIVHPSFWVKTSSKVYFQGIVSPKFWSKVVNIEAYYDIYKYMNRDQIKFPDIVYQSSPIFGTPLQEVLARPDHAKLSVPLIVEQTIQYLLEHKATKVPGIFRFNGKEAEVQKLKRDFDKGERVNWDQIKDPHIAAGLLKLYLIELPEPLFLAENYEALLKSHQSKDRLADIQAIIQKLPKANRSLLSYLLGAIAAVEINASSNNMTAANLSIVFAPELIKPPKERIVEATENGPILNSIMKTIIENHEKLIPLLK